MTGSDLRAAHAGREPVTWTGGIARIGPRDAARRKTSGGAPQVVAIIGGGFTGALVAWNLAGSLDDGLDDGAVRIVVVEPRDKLGAGLAYSTEDPSHRINVPASRITKRTDDKDDFVRWIREKRIDVSPESVAPDGALYPQRGLIGDYVSDALAGDLTAGRVEHVMSRAMSLSRPGDFRIALEGLGDLEADHVVIATSHPPPGCPAAFDHVKDDHRLVADPSDPSALAQVAQAGGKVLVLGTGLTSADVIASLHRQGFAGNIRALSRRGLRSRGHASGYPETSADFSEDPPRTALGLLRRIRRAVREDAEKGLPWQAALDRVRTDGPVIWAALPPRERARLVKRLRVWWDVHRFRVAPQVEAAMDALIAQGRLEISAGRLGEVAAGPDGLTVAWTVRGGGLVRETFDRVILTTGPAHDGITRSTPFLSSAYDEGLVRPDELGLGLSVCDGCRAVGADGAPVQGLWVAGPLARGHVGELMGIPEVTGHAEEVARRLTLAIGSGEREARAGGVSA